MSWWSSFKGAFDGGSMTNPDIGAQQSGPSGGRSDANVIVTDERAMMLSTVFACVRLLAQTGATLPLGFYTRTADGREALDENHHLCTLLKYSPNNFMTAKEFRHAMWVSRVLWGNAYAKIEWMGNRPISLVPLKPEYMTVERTSEGLVYLYTTKGETKAYEQREVFHLKGFGDGVMGISVLAHARHSLGISVSADRYAAKSFSGTPNGVLHADEFLTDEQREKMRSVYGGVESTASYKADGQMMILEGGLKYQSILMPPDDLQMLESRQFQVPEICRFFGVPAVMVDGSAGATAAWPASYEQQVLSFLTFTLKPYLEEWEDKATDSLLVGAEKRTVFAEHKVDGLLRADSETRQKVQSGLVQNGLRTRNEMRKLDNYPPVEGGGELTVQVNMANLDDLPQINANPTQSQQKHDTNDSDRITELKQQVERLSSEQRIISSRPVEEKAFSITLPPTEPHTVNITNDVHVPPLDPPVVNVKNEVPVPNVTNNVQPTDVRVENIVPVPSVTVENTVETPTNTKVSFQRDSKGNITSAETDG